MIQLISKHWTYANSTGAFSTYPIDPKDETAEKLTGVITRWFIGRRCIIKKGKSEVQVAKEKLLHKKGRWRSNLVARQTTSIKSLVGSNAPLVQIFEESGCHSDTEESSSGKMLQLKLPWQTDVFIKLCELADSRTAEQIHQEAGHHFPDSKLFEKKRRNTDKIEKGAMVPMDLPLDCYNTKFLDTLSEQG
ncbi:hypothetical protein PSTG_09833 [Puccinia striiformis f. sp. tritici PST-78]|uniref:Uncharacterized protein n=1 Tax=Puccinia striiformis f. sp. tritici PST-78 TaxID=1165861 RepID=A0A0L0VC44_9BASI|nr:hypothetical protein PSTG_09833 [Puccinia striiformis f. sp. tritici PST-78]